MKKGFKLFHDYIFNKSEMTEKEYSFAKKSFVVDAVCENCAANWAGGTYLVGLLAYLNASEAMSSFIVSLGVFAALFQIFTPYLMRNTSFNKPFVMTGRILVRPLLGIIFLLPFITGRNTASLAIAAIIYFVSCASANMIGVPSNIWFMKCAEKNGRVGKYLGIKDGVTNVGLVVAFAVAAYVTKSFSGENEIYAYLCFGVLCLTAAVVSFGFLFFTKEPYERKAPEKINLFAAMADMVRVAKCREYFVFCIFLNIGMQLVNSIVNVYFIQRLHLSMEFLSYRLMADLIIRSAFAPLCGRLGDKIGMKNVLKICVAIMAVHHLLYAFVNENNVMAIMIITMVISGLSYAGYGLSNFKFMFEALPAQNRSTYMVCSNTVAIGVGYIVSLCASIFLAKAKGFSINILGMNFDDMKILFVVVFIAQVLAVLSLFKKHEEV